MSTADVALSFGVSRQRVGQIQRGDPTFPRPQTELDGGPVWIRAGIEAWSALHRPAAAQGSVFVPHGARILHAAEELAVSLGHSHIGNTHLWVAILACDVAATAVFRSMGVTPSALRRMQRRSDPRRDDVDGGSPRRGARMNARAQDLLSAGAAKARKRGSQVMEPIDLAFGLIERHENGPHGRNDHVLGPLESRGFDVNELCRRLEAVRADPEAWRDFEVGKLKRRPRRVDPRRKVLGELAASPLGHDPWTRQPWGSAFALWKDDRMLKLGDEQWFFAVDRDGFFIRTADGRPVGYRWRLKPTPSREPVNGLLEVLPMPPPGVGYWPDYRFPRD